MAKETVLRCDAGQGACKQSATCYRVWRDGDRQAYEVDLCNEHARPLLEVVEQGRLVDLPAKPRRAMEATKLVTTPATAHLKKKD